MVLVQVTVHPHLVLHKLHCHPFVSPTPVSNKVAVGQPFDREAVHGVAAAWMRIQ
jgi:hypothetical protein